MNTKQKPQDPWRYHWKYSEASEKEEKQTRVKVRCTCDMLRRLDCVLPRWLVFHRSTDAEPRSPTAVVVVTVKSIVNPSDIGMRILVLPFQVPCCHPDDRILEETTNNDSWSPFQWHLLQYKAGWIFLFFTRYNRCTWVYAASDDLNGMPLKGRFCAYRSRSAPCTVGFSYKMHSRLSHGRPVIILPRCNFHITAMMAWTAHHWFVWARFPGNSSFSRTVFGFRWNSA